MRISYETSRLAEIHLSDAYEKLNKIKKQKINANKNSNSKEGLIQLKIGNLKW
jgi:ribosomal protein S21